MERYLGEIAALSTSLAWSLTSTFFTLASRRVGSVITNRMRLLLAVLFLTATHWLLLAEPFPTQVEPERWFWLSISGVVGLLLGDAFLFQAFVWIGPRLSMLMMSLAPVIAGIFSWIFLAEVLSALQVLGVVLTVSGVAWVVWQGDGRRDGTSKDKQYLRGILFGFGAAAGQALGLITSKLGLGGDFPALSGTLMRMLAAAGIMWLVTILRGKAPGTFSVLRRDRPARWQLIAGSIVGPFLGVWLSLIAVQKTEVGVASALMSLPPIFLLPIGYVWFKERIGWQAVFGTFIAVCGVMILFL